MQILVQNCNVQNTQHSLHFAPFLKDILSDILQVASQAPNARRETFAQFETVLEALQSFCANKRLPATASAAKRLAQGIKDLNFLPPFITSSLGVPDASPSGSNPSTSKPNLSTTATKDSMKSKLTAGPNVWVVKKDSVWRLGEGTEVSGGKLEVGEEGIVVLDRTCMGFTLKDMVLKGVCQALSTLLISCVSGWHTEGVCCVTQYTTTCAVYSEKTYGSVCYTNSIHTYIWFPSKRSELTFRRLYDESMNLLNGQNILRENLCGMKSCSVM